MFWKNLSFVVQSVKAGCNAYATNLDEALGESLPMRVWALVAGIAVAFVLYFLFWNRCYAIEEALKRHNCSKFCLALTCVAATIICLLMASAIAAHLGGCLGSISRADLVQPIIWTVALVANVHMARRRHGA